MISPDMYYEKYIKGKSPKIIIRQIRILKKEINKLKKELEEYNSESPEILMDPNPLTRIKVSRNIKISSSSKNNSIRSPST